MGASAGDFLDHLEAAGLLDPDTLKPLWKQVARTPDLTAEKLAAALVENGQLTAFQAKNALKALGVEAPGEKPAEPAPNPAPAAKAPAEKPEATPAAALPSEAEISPSDRAAALAAKYLARGGAVPPASAPAAPKKPANDDLDLDLAPIDDEPKSRSAAPEKQQPAAAAPQKPAAPASTPQKPVATPQKNTAATNSPRSAATPTPKSAAPAGPVNKEKKAPAAPHAAASKAAPAAAGPAKAEKPAAPAVTKATASPPAKNEPPAAPAIKKKAPTPTESKATDEEDLPTLEPIAELEPLASVDELTSLEGLSGVPDQLTPMLTGQAPLVESPPVAAPLDLAALEVDPLAVAGPSMALALAKQKRGPWWKSPWHWGGIGGGALLLLLMLWLGWRWVRGTPETLLAAADELYTNQTYADAAKKYDTFVWRFPSDERAGHATVRRGLARLHAVRAENEGDWASVLETAQAELPVMAESPDYAASQEELAKLLPQVAAGLVAQAKARSADKSAQQALLERAEEAVVLLDDSTYWTDAWRRSLAAQHVELAESVDDLKREVDRERAFAAALDAMQAALKKGKVSEAFAAHRNLVRSYPATAAEPLLRDVMTTAVKKLREQAKPYNEPLPAAAAVAPKNATVICSTRYGGTAPVDAAQRFYVSLGGSVFALESKTGRVLWRDTAGPAAPAPVALAKAGSGSDALVWQAATHELVRRSGDDGREIWRAAFGEPCAAPVVAGDRVLVAARSGKLFALEAGTGKVAAALALPQELAVAPAYDAKGKRIYQLADEATLYVVSADLATCQDAVYLGHGAGSVATPPVVVQGVALIAENVGADRALVHVVTGSETTSFKEVQNALPLAGRVLSPPAALADALVAATDRGAVYLLKVDAADEQQPVNLAAQSPAEANSRALPFVAAEGNHYWVADTGLARWAKEPGKNQLQRRWLKFEASDFLQPPEKTGNVLLTVRAEHGTSGASIAALRIDATGSGASDAETLWETRLGVAPAGPLVTNQGQPPLFAVTADGSALAIEKSALDQGRAELVLEKSSPPALLEQGAPLPHGWAWRDAMAEHRVFAFDSTAAKAGVRNWEAAANDALGGDVAACGNGLLVPFATGRLELRDPATGAPLALPFQPRLEPGVTVRWARPAATEGTATEFVAADSRRKIYRVTLAAGSAPYLKPVATADLPGEPCGPVAVLGSTALVATRGATADQLTPFALADLKPAAAKTLASRVVFGPERVGNVAVVGLESGALAWYAPTGGELQETAAATAPGTLAGTPALLGERELLVASADGHVRRFSLTTGELAGDVDLGVPLASGPVVLGTRMFVFGREGTLHYGALPAKP